MDAACHVLIARGATKVRVARRGSSGSRRASVKDGVSPGEARAIGRRERRRAHVPHRPRRRPGGRFG